MAEGTGWVAASEAELHTRGDVMQRWKRLASELVVTSEWLTLASNTYELPSGNLLPEYYILERSGFVLVVPILDGMVVLVRQYRPATDREYICLPAGYVDPGEAPEAAAERELYEETGLLAKAPRLIGELDPLPAYLRSPASIVLCQASGLLAVQDTDEISAVSTHTWDDVARMIRDGAINEMQAVSALLLARLHLGIA